MPEHLKNFKQTPITCLTSEGHDRHHHGQDGIATVDDWVCQLTRNRHRAQISGWVRESMDIALIWQKKLEKMVKIKKKYDFSISIWAISRRPRTLPDTPRHFCGSINIISDRFLSVADSGHRLWLQQRSWESHADSIGKSMEMYENPWKSTKIR